MHRLWITVMTSVQIACVCECVCAHKQCVKGSMYLCAYGFQKRVFSAFSTTLPIPLRQGHSLNPGDHVFLARIKDIKLQQFSCLCLFGS